MEFLSFTIENLSPLRIGDDSTSREGQADSLKYIPGSAVRGLVVSKLAKDPAFEDIKSVLFSSNVVFCNAYPTVDGKDLLPSPKGFYEDKVKIAGRKEIVNIFDGDQSVSGKKRAGLGEFSVVSEDCIVYYTVETEGSLRINVADKDVFRTEAIAAGYLFKGFVKLSGNPEVDDRICAVFSANSELNLGNGRSSGLGRCRVIGSSRVSELPYGAKAFDANGGCYIRLTSPLAMRSGNGELCGIDIRSLESIFGVKDLIIEKASTSVRKICGYNRTLGADIPSMSVYEAGSVFRLKYTGTIPAETMNAVMWSGIGVRRNEGFGRIIFDKNYEKISFKLPAEVTGKKVMAAAPQYTKDEINCAKIAAKGLYLAAIKRAIPAYVVAHPINKKDLASSQLGNVQSILTEHRYQSGDVLFNSLGFHFAHAAEKEANRNIQKAKASLSPLEKRINEIFATPLPELLSENGWVLKDKKKVMGFDYSELLDEDSERLLKSQLILDLLRFENKEE